VRRKLAKAALNSSRACLYSNYECGGEPLTLKKGFQMFSAMDPLNVILLAVAAIVAWKLWSVLGTRTGLEKPPVILRPVPDQPKPQSDQNQSVTIEVEPETKSPIWQGHAEAGSALAKGLEALAMRSPDFTVPSFISGASVAYEMVLEAFSNGNKAALKNLLSKDLLENFVSAIEARNAKGHSMKFQFVGVKSAKITNAALTGNKAQVEVDFTSEMISATLDKSAGLVEGDDKTIRTVTDLWTFERDVTSRDPNWKLVATNDNA
jgi:predicted lipid-binding transport protein (Tim44 family)